MLEQAIALVASYDVAILVSTAVLGILAITFWTVVKRKNSVEAKETA